MSEHRSGNGTSRTVVITGASAGVGRACAERFARDCSTVVLVARGEDGLAAAAQEVQRAGAKALPMPADVADADALKEVADRTEREVGPIDVWVNDAMVTVFGTIADLDAAELKRVTEVTYLGQVNGTLAALPYMRARDRGVIVSVGSALAFHAIPAQAPYCAAKFAVRGFNQALRAELIAAGSNVRLTEVHLPAVNTPQFGWCRSKFGRRHPQPVPPIYQPDVVAKVIHHAASSPRRQRVVGSWNRIIVTFGTVAPGIADHFVARTAIDDQIAPTDIERGDVDNLLYPEDQAPGTDRGAVGRFSARATGVKDRGFLASIPEMFAQLARAVAARCREVLR